MRNQLISLFLFVLLPLAARAEEARVLSMSGNVEVRQTREGQWTAAVDKIEIAEGGGIRTGADGGAVLLMPNKTKVWLKDNSTLEIEQRQTLSSRLALVFGRIKIRVPHLMRKEKFEVRTPAAVCAVRGTEFTMDTTEDGKMNLQVLFGEVKLKFIVPPEKGRMEFNIPQGQGLSLEEKGKSAKPVLLTAANERAALENWNPGIKPEERQKGLQEKENDRAQIKEFASVTNSAESAVKSFLNVVKESDLEAGRTLNDVHGNLVRVDQRMIRPAANEIQFFNLVKRPVYNTTSAASVVGFAYNGAQAITDRLDYMQMTMAFNKDLPQRIEEWPSFFNGNSVDPTWASFVMANRTKKDEIFFIAQGYTDQGDRGLVNNTLVVDPYKNGFADRNVIIAGVLTDDSGTGITAMAGLGKIANLQVQDSGVNNGTLYYTEADRLTPDTAALVGGDGANKRVIWAVQAGDIVAREFVAASDYTHNSPDKAPLIQYQATMYDVGNQQGGGGSNSYLWFAKENYAIGNSGQVKTADDFTSSSLDPFSILKDSALETVMYLKQSNYAVNDPLPAYTKGVSDINTSGKAKDDILNTDYFAYDHETNGTNIDLVFIPDLIIAAVQRMLPAITKLKD